MRRHYRANQRLDTHRAAELELGRLERVEFQQQRPSLVEQFLVVDLIDLVDLEQLLVQFVLVELQLVERFVVEQFVLLEQLVELQQFIIEFRGRVVELEQFVEFVGRRRAEWGRWWWRRGRPGYNPGGLGAIAPDTVCRST